MPRLYTHLIDARTCEAPGCTIRTCTLHRCAGGWVKACTRAHAQEADRRLSREEKTK